jgi:hypothetical protein
LIIIGQKPWLITDVRLLCKAWRDRKHHSASGNQYPVKEPKAAHAKLSRLARLPRRYLD